MSDKKNGNKVRAAVGWEMFWQGRKYRNEICVKQVKIKFQNKVQVWEQVDRLYLFGEEEHFRNKLLKYRMHLMNIIRNLTG